MDDDNFLGNAAPAAGADDGAMVVHSAHSSPSRGRRKFTWLRKVAYIWIRFLVISTEMTYKKLTSRSWDRRTLPPEPRHRCKNFTTPILNFQVTLTGLFHRRVATFSAHRDVFDYYAL